MHKAFAGNVQVLTDHTGFPVWTAPVEPGSTHDITAARTHALPALYRAASLEMPTLADKGYTGAGIGIKVAANNSDPDPGTRWRNALITSMLAPAQGVGKVGSGGWLGDELDGAFWLSRQGSGGGGDSGLGAVGQADEADGQVAQGGHDLGAVAGAQLVAVLIEDDVTDPVEPVLDSPVPLDPGGNLLGLGMLHGQ